MYGKVQSESARSAYARSQMQMRQWNKEMNEFAKMQEQYAKRGEEPPYKTLGSFRRSYRSEEGSLAYAKSHYSRRDERQFTRYKAVLGDGLSDTLAKFQEMKYNSPRRFDLLRQYKESVERGKVDNVGFGEFEKVLNEANRKIIGIKTSAGVVVEGISFHLIERIIGIQAEKRNGVSIDKIVDTLKNGFCDGVIRVNEKGQRSVGFVGDGVFVSFNIDTNIVIQCRPSKRRKT